MSSNALREKLESKNKEELVEEALKLQHQVEWYKRQLFGKKSERFTPNNQQTELALDIESVEIPLTTEHVEYERKKPSKKTEGHGRGEMPTHLPIVDVTIEPDEDVEGCRKIGEEISWEIDFKPGTMFVRRYIRPKYARKDENDIVVGKLPARPVEKGNYGPGIMTSITVEKYLYHMPLYRQIQMFKDYFRIKIAESTMSDIIKHTSFWLDAVYSKMKNELLKSDYIMADETPIPVIIKTSKKKTKKCYYWVYHDPVRKITVFEYRNGRGREGPNEFLKDYKGILQIDGYQGYNDVVSKDGVTRAACMAHVRRYFEKALDYNREKAEYAMNIINSWFAVDAEAREKGLSHDERLGLRKANNLDESFTDFKKWMIKQCEEEMPQSLIRKACEYGLGQWGGFDSFLTDGRVELSNNLVENAIRPVTLGRKNYLFKGSESSAQRGAVIYSVINTAKQHEINVPDYIALLLEKLPGEKAGNIEKYLPWNVEMPRDYLDIEK